MAARSVGPYPYTARAARIGNRFLWSVNTPVDIRGTIESATLTWNGDVASKSTIGKLVEKGSIKYITRLADHVVIEALASRGCDEPFRKSWIDLLRIVRVVLVEAICKFLLISGRSAIVAVVILGI